MMRGVAVACMIVLTGCATTGGGDGDAVGISGSGNVVIKELTIVKQFGAACEVASSGTQAASDASAERGGTVGADVVARTGELGANAASAFVGSLAALDECGPGLAEPTVHRHHGRHRHRGARGAARGGGIAGVGRLVRRGDR